MIQTKQNDFSSVAELLDGILEGNLGPKPETLIVTGASNVYQTTQFPSSTTKYHNYYLLLRVEASFGACSHTSDQLNMESGAEFSGLPLDEVLRDKRLPVQIAAMDAYLGAVFRIRSAAPASSKWLGALPFRKRSSVIC